MVDPKIIREWLDKAEEDFLYASASLKEDLPFFSQICFHFQQSAEKYLKTYIVANELNFKKIHNLLILLKLCSSQSSNFEQIKEACELLNRYYVDARYPVQWPTNHSKATAAEAQKAAESIKNFIKSKIKL